MPSIDVYTKKREYESKFGEAKERWKQALDLYNRDYDIRPNKLKKVHQVIPLTGRSIANVLASSVTPKSEDIHIHVEPIDGSQTAEDQANKMENWAKEVIAETGKELLIDLPFQHALNLILYGVTIERVLPDADNRWGPAPYRFEGESEQGYRDRLADWESRRKTEFPFDVMVLDPQVVYHNARYKQPTELLEYGERKVEEIRETYRNNNLFGDKKGDQTVEYINYIGPQHRIITLANLIGDKVASEELLLDVPNILGMTHSVAFAGESKMDPEGRIKHEQVGTLWHMGDALKEQARIITAQSIIFQRMPFPIMKAKDASKVKIDWSEPGSVAEDKTGTLDRIDTGSINPEILQLLVNIEKQLEQHTGAKLLGGQHVGATSGAHEELYLDQGLDRFQPLIRGLENIVAMRLERMARYTQEIIKNPVVRRNKLTNFKGYYKFEVNFNSTDILKNVRLIQLGLSLVNAGRISQRMFLEEFIKTEDTSRIMREIGADRVMEQQGMIQLISQQASRKAGLEDAYEKAKEEAKTLKQQGSAPKPQLGMAPNLGAMPAAQTTAGLKELMGEGFDEEALQKELSGTK